MPGLSRLKPLNHKSLKDAFPAARTATAENRGSPPPSHPHGKCDQQYTALLPPFEALPPLGLEPPWDLLPPLGLEPPCDLLWPFEQDGGVLDEPQPPAP